MGHLSLSIIVTKFRSLFYGRMIYHLKSPQSFLVGSFLLSLSFQAKSSFEYQGQLSLSAAQRPSVVNKENHSRSSLLEAQADLNYKTQSGLKLRLQPWVKSEPGNSSNDEKMQSELLEANAVYKSGRQSIKMGLSNVNWEGTDFINPMDLMNAKNFRDPMNSMNRSSGLASWSVESESWQAEVVYIPHRSRDLLPGSNSLWWPRELSLPTGNSDIQFLIPEQVSYEINESLLLDKALSNNVATRIQYRGNLWDVSLQLFEGAASPVQLSPILTATVVQVSPNQVFQLQNPVVIQPIYYRQRAMALAFSKAWDSVILRASGQHLSPLGTDSRIPTWSQLMVYEIEKHLSLFQNDLVLLFEYTENRKASSSEVTSFSSALKNVYLVGLRYSFLESWILSSAYFQDYKAKGSYTRLGLAKSWDDHLQSELIVDSFSGRSDSLLGVFDKNDQATLKISYLF